MKELKEEIKELFDDLVLFKNPDKRIKLMAVLFWICIIYLIVINFKYFFIDSGQNLLEKV